MALPSCRVEVARLSKKVLQLSYDGVESAVRKRLLEHAGFEVVPLPARGGIAQMDLGAAKIDVVVVDHAADFEERWALVRWLKVNHPQIQVIALRRNASEEPITLADGYANGEDP